MKKTKHYITFGLIILVLLVIGFLGFKVWNGIVMPNIFNISKFSLQTFYVFALLAGFLSFFAPCAIALVPAYAAYYLELKEKREKKKTNKFKHALKMGFVGALGIFVLYAILGIILSILGTSATAYFTFSKPIIAGILILMGVAILVDYKFENNYLFEWLNKKVLKGKAKNNLFFFGILYGATALGCAMLVFVPLIIVPLATGNFITAIISFLLYSFSFGLAMILTTLLVAYSKTVMITKIAASSGIIKKVTGIILLLSAAYLLYFYMRFGM